MSLVSTTTLGLSVESQLKSKGVTIVAVRLLGIDSTLIKPLGYDVTSIFTVSPSDLDRLDPGRAVDVFRGLLWAEASAVGVASSLVNVPSAINVGDGGVDAQVDAQPTSTGQGIIAHGINRYQIKAGKFSLNDSSLRNLLGRHSNKEELNTRIKSCLDANGRFVIVLFGCDTPDKYDDQFRVEFVKYIQTHWGYTDPEIAVWRQNQICGFLSRYPSLALEVKGINTAQFERHKTWASHSDMKAPFVSGPSQDDLISEVRAHLRTDSSPIHVHLSGDPGVGKTRLALEATNTADLSPLVLYFDKPTQLSDSGLLSEITREDNTSRCILVVDECRQQDSSYLWNRLRAFGQRIKLLTLFSDSTNLSGDTILHAAPLLTEDQIKAILAQYGLESVDASRWSDFCSGSPRVAHLLGSNLRNNPEDVLREPDNVPVWDRFLTGSDDPNSPGVERRKLVLRCLSLYRRFGYSAEYKHHISAISARIREVDASITDIQIVEAITELKQLHILQGDYLLYITPKLLHLYLLSDWFKRYGTTYEFNVFIEPLPGELADWHREMFEYAGEQPETAILIRDLLGPGGAFPSIQELDTGSGSRFFFALTNANPEAALVCLERTLASVDHGRLQRFVDGRRYVVWSLERIVIWRDLFARGARLLILLARAETESVANNATGVFSDLYSPGYGRLAPTELPPMDRLPLLDELFTSGRSADISLALTACDKALETHGMTRTVGAEYQGLKHLPDLWMPKTWGELYEYYEAVWNLVSARYLSLDKESAKMAIETLLNRARGLSQNQHMAPIVQKTLEDLAGSDMVDNEELVKVIAGIIHYDRKRLPPDVISKWEEIRDSIVGSDFGSQLKRYVGMNVFEDHIDHEGNTTDVARDRIGTLAREAAEEPVLLESEFTWLTTEKAVRGVEFGFDLGSIDTENSFLPILIEKQKLGDNRAFLGGYFAALLHRDVDLWESAVDKIACDDETVSWVPELTWRSGITNRAAKRILGLLESAKIGSDDLESFSRGGIVRKIDESIFIEWLRFLLSTGSRKSIAIALQLHHYYYAYPKPVRPMPRDLTLELILHDSLFDLDQRDEWVSPMADDFWEWTSLALLKQNPDCGLEIAEAYIPNFGLEGTIIGGYHSSSQKVINAITKRSPTEVWNLAIKELGPPGTEVAFNISHWLRGGGFYPEPGGALHLFPTEEIWNWVEIDKETRAPYLANLVPPQLTRKEGNESLARDMLVRYGNLKSVRNEFHANFGSEGWVGPGSVHFLAKKQGLEELRSTETDANVMMWIGEEIESLDYMIRREQIEEEHRGF